ncbi:MAG: hypothetical protein WD294_14480 [Phycisphaeraceae bacterium]
MRRSITIRYLLPPVRTVLLITLALSLNACGEATSPPPTLEGAWLGAGDFRASRGSADVEAQLELHPDGSYEFLILQPSIMTLAGTEKGQWSREGDHLTLTPGAVGPTTPEQVDKEAPLSVLRTGQTAKPKTLTITERQLEFRDGPMSITFSANRR